MKTYLILKFKQNLFSKVIWSSTFKCVVAQALHFLGFNIFETSWKSWVHYIAKGGTSSESKIATCKLMGECPWTPTGRKNLLHFRFKCRRPSAAYFFQCWQLWNCPMQFLIAAHNNKRPL